MFKKISFTLFLSVFALLANDDKESAAKTGSTETQKEQSFIQIDAKKSKKYEIYTLDGTYVADGILDFNARANVTELKSGSYLIVIGKKAYQFSIN